MVTNVGCVTGVSVEKSVGLLIVPRRRVVISQRVNAIYGTRNKVAYVVGVAVVMA